MPDDSLVAAILLINQTNDQNSGSQLRAYIICGNAPQSGRDLGHEKPLLNKSYTIGFGTQSPG